MEVAFLIFVMLFALQKLQGLQFQGILEFLACCFDIQDREKVELKILPFGLADLDLLMRNLYLE